MSAASIFRVRVSPYVESNPIKQADWLRFRSPTNNSISRTLQQISEFVNKNMSIEPSGLFAAIDLLVWLF